MGYTFSRGQYGKTFLSKYNKRRCTTVILHINRNEFNNLDTSNSNNFIGSSDLPHSNIQTDSPYNTLNNLQKLIDTESSVSINDKIMDQNNSSEEI